MAVALAACAADDAPGSTRGGPTIVSLNPCLDAILVEVAAPAQILALSHYSRDPSASSMDVARAREFGVTGGTVEEVIAIDPDIVLASTFIAPTTRNALERLGVQVETFGSPVSVEESVEQVRDLAGLVGRDAAGEALVARIERSLEPAAHERDIATLLWQPGQIVPGETTLIAQLLRENGFTSQSAQRGLGQADYVSLESLLAEPPELLLVAGDSTGQRHPMLARLADTQVETLDPGLLYCGGPTIVAVQDRLKQIRASVNEKARR